MLTEVIRGRILAAMKAGNTLERGILKVALGELQAVAVRTGQDLTDEEATAVVRKLVKSNHESLELIKDAAQVERLRAETAILEELLPATLSVEDIVTALDEVRADILAATGAGQATGVAMKHLRGRGLPVEGKDVAAAVRVIRE